MSFSLFFFPFFLSLFVAIVCVLACILFFGPRARCGWHRMIDDCMAKLPCRTRDVHLYLVGCDHRARLSEASAQTLVVLGVDG